MRNLQIIILLVLITLSFKAKADEFRFFSYVLYEYDSKVDGNLKVINRRRETYIINITNKNGYPNFRITKTNIHNVTTINDFKIVYTKTLEKDANKLKKGDLFLHLINEYGDLAEFYYGVDNNPVLRFKFNYETEMFEYAVALEEDKNYNGK